MDFYKDFLKYKMSQFTGLRELVVIYGLFNERMPRRPEHCCMDIEPPKFNNHSSHVNSKQNKRTPQTDMERTLHDPGRIKNLKKTIKCKYLEPRLTYWR